MNEHQCIKCQTNYKSNDEDAYYCDSCFTEKQRIAKEVDAKFANKPRKETKSAIQAYDEACKRSGGKFPHWSTF